MKSLSALMLLIMCSFVFADEQSSAKAAVAIAIAKAKTAVKSKAAIKPQLYTSIEDAQKEADEKDMFLIVWVGAINKEAVEQIKQVHVKVDKLPAYPTAKCAVFTVDKTMIFKSSVSEIPTAQTLKNIIESIEKANVKKKTSGDFFISVNLSESEYDSDPVCTVDEFGRKTCTPQFVANSAVVNTVQNVAQSRPVVSRFQQWRMNRPFRLFRFFLR